MSEIKFVNRIEEFKALRNWCSSKRATPMYIYGPEGCGKTRLLKEFIKKFDRLFGSNAIAVYIDAMEGESIDKAILVPKTVKLSKEVLISIIEKFIGLNVGRVLSSSISTILERAIVGRRIEDNYVLVVVDDITRVIGLNKIEWYVKWLYELMWKIREDYRPKAINFIVTTSEGESLELVERHRHVHVVMMWNLDKNAFKELFYQLKPPETLDFESVWRLLGGNPGKLIELCESYNWNTTKMITIYTERVRRVVREFIRKGLQSELEALIKDPDNADRILTDKMDKTIRILIKHNMLMRVGLLLINLQKPKPDLEIGLGEHFAWQVPMYKDIMKRILSKI